MMEDITISFKVTALLTIQQVYRPLANILADKGTQFAIYLNGILPSSTQEIAVQALLRIVCQVPVRGQSRKYCKRR